MAGDGAARGRGEEEGRYRAALDAVPWDEEERRRVIDEARVSDAASIAVFNDLGVAVLSSRP